MSFRTNALTLFLISSPDSYLRPTWKWKCQLNRYNWQTCITEISHQTRKQSLSFRFFFVTFCLIWNYFNHLNLKQWLFSWHLRQLQISNNRILQPRLGGFMLDICFPAVFLSTSPQMPNSTQLPSLLVDAGNSHAASETGSRPQAHGDSILSPQNSVFPVTLGLNSFLFAAQKSTEVTIFYRFSLAKLFLSE